MEVWIIMQTIEYASVPSTTVVYAVFDNLESAEAAMEAAPKGSTATVSGFSYRIAGMFTVQS